MDAATSRPQARHQMHERRASAPPSRTCPRSPSATAFADRLRRIADRIDN